MTTKHFFTVDPDDPEQRRDVANQMFAALKTDAARANVLNWMNEDKPAHPMAGYARHLREMDEARKTKKD